MSTMPPPTPFCNISDVERDTAIAKETLRVWERRYGFPKPQRDANGERIYAPEQVQRLRQIKRLIDLGYRPGKVMPLSDDELTALAASFNARAPLRSPDDPDLIDCIELLKAHKVFELRQRLQQLALQSGLRHFVVDLVAPLTSLVGDAWSAGELAVFEEHLFSEIVQSVMRNAILAVSRQDDTATPRIVLTTVPLERHGLGLLMAEALFALDGAHCLPLGVQTPLADIVDAVRIQRADVVALSFSSVMSPRAALENITELQSRLGPGVEVWVGGACASLVKRQLGIDCVIDLNEIPGRLARWRTAHTPRAA
jgi:DNA-binding transcriptional MerR regulator/methylmalonyl-CoA mutase cobalamin-binding subunit